MVLAGGRPVISSNALRTHTTIRWFRAGELPPETSVADSLFLGLRGENACFAVDVQADLAERHSLGPAVDFRSLVTQGTVGEQDMGIIALARSLTHSAARSRYCGACGAPTREEHAGWKRICTRCGETWFPRVDPVVIMLVHDGSRVLLAREPHFPPGLYSALAGFIEPGETIEEAVRRETKEETGVLLSKVAIIANQPWPMPHSLMIGCHAIAPKNAGLRIDKTEIEDARWFERDEVRHMIRGTHESGLFVPPRQALANTLLTLWLASATVPQTHMET